MNKTTTKTWWSLSLCLLLAASCNDPSIDGIEFNPGEDPSPEATPESEPESTREPEPTPEPEPAPEPEGEECGGAARNACGGCEALGGAVGDVCGVCGSGRLACDVNNLDVYLCVGDRGESARNACGGCMTLAGAPGDVCGACERAILVCGQDNESLACEGDANACGGCEALAQEPGQACGNCLLDRIECDGNEAVRCTGNTDCPTGFMPIPAGTFQMGSPLSEPGRGPDETQHEVRLTRAFLMQTKEVTQGQWEALMGNNPSRFPQCGSDCPVEQVTWYEALAYANALSRQEGLAECFALSGCIRAPGEGMECTVVSVNAPGGNVYECQGYRLPTEAEWEFAARAGTQTAFFNGGLTETGCGLDPSLDRAGWYCGNAGITTHPVGQKQSNGYGLFDVHGNVHEWVWDLYLGDYASLGGTDPVNNSSGSTRVLRGGSWTFFAELCRAAIRFGFDPANRFDILGFRLSKSIDR